MSVARVAARYGRAFVDALSQQNRLQDHQSFLEFCDLVTGNHELSACFANVAIGPLAKQKIVEDLAARTKLPETVTRFITILAQNRRLGVLQAVREAVSKKIDEALKIQTVNLTVAAPLLDGDQARFQARLADVLGTKVRVNTDIDPEILGGAVAQVGSFIYDGSVRGQLNRLRGELVKEI